MKKYFDTKEKKLAALCSFFIPVFIWLMVCILHGIYPFGKNSVMTGDITYQFIDYLAYFKSIIFTNNDLTYTFSKTLGGDMAGFSAYYLFSPFNFLLLFFPNRMLPLGLLIIIMIKCGFMSLLFFIMLSGIYGFKKRSVIFAVTYSLMGYAVVYFQLYAYFDDMMLLPLIVLGLHRLMEDPRKRVLYTVSLSLSIILNYYIGWMLCLFSALYFIYRMVSDPPRKAETGSDDVPGKWYMGAIRSRVISFALSSLFAGMISAFVLLPSLLSLRGEKDSFHLGLYRTMDITAFFSRFYTDSFRGNISTCLPNVYCGVLVCLLTFMYFFNRSIRLRERLASAGLLLFLILNLYINTLNVAWHGFNRPIGFPYRYSFLLTFVMLLFAYRGSLVPDSSKLFVRLAAAAGIYLVYSAFIYIKGSEVIGAREIIIDGLILLAIVSAMLLRQKGKLGLGAMILVLGVIQLGDLSENIRHAFYYFEFSPMEDYIKYIDRVGKAVSAIRAEDDGFYRLEKTFKRTHNDSMQFDYAGLTHYSSCEKKDVISYMKKLGFRDNGNWSFYDGGSTALVDSVFGVKYIISHYDYMGKKYKRFGKEKYPEEWGEDKYFTYRNQYVLPLMFASDTGVSEMDGTYTNPFEYQSRLADAVSGSENNMFTPAEIDEYNLINLTEETHGNIHRFKKIDPEKEACIEYRLTITAQTDGKLLEAYFDAPDYQNAEIMLGDDSKGEYFSEYSWSVLDLAKHDEGEVLSIKIVPGDDTFEMTDSWIYFEDMVQLKKWAAEINEQECRLEKITSSHLKGRALLDSEKQLVFSFPYEEDWEVLVDGKKAETRVAAGALLSVRAAAGEHEVELVYHQAGRIPGLLISLAGLTGAIVFNMHRRKQDS